MESMKLILCGDSAVGKSKLGKYIAKEPFIFISQFYSWNMYTEILVTLKHTSFLMDKNRFYQNDFFSMTIFYKYYYF